nr:RNA-directed DNA polymerase, eukaryota, reverse transcriptase zinc-binding domain protein [Tanacetum cinerariifolium]
WVPDFEEDGKEVYGVKDGSHEDDMYGGVSENLKDVNGKSDREEVPETNFKEIPDKSIFEGNSVRHNDVHFEDPFGIYEGDVPIEKVDNWSDENRVNNGQEDGADYGILIKERIQMLMAIGGGKRLIQEVEKVDAMEVAQKAKIKWSIEGDKNSKYYHGVLNKKRGRLTIRGVLEDERDFIKGISLEQNDNLEREVSNEEIKWAVWECRIDKAPGLDGFTFGFYRRYWDIIGNDVVDAIKWFFCMERSRKEVIRLFITLIPKVPNANMIKDFRPINLIGSLYKVIAKVLENRLVTNKKKQSMIFKVDFEKAYDSVRWDFIDDILRRFSFREKWINMNKSNLMGISVDSYKVKHAAAKIAWCGDIAFKKLVPRLYAPESMKNIEVASKLSHGDLEFSFRRNPRGGVEQAQFERFKEMVEVLL